LPQERSRIAERRAAEEARKAQEAAEKAAQEAAERAAQEAALEAQLAAEEERKAREAAARGWPALVRHMVVIELTDTERAALITLLAGLVEGDPMPESERILQLRQILAKLRAASEA
jgi:hypothetical protein